MKHRKLFGLLLVSSILTSCQFHESVNKDLTTGAYSRGNGISCDEVALKINGKSENRSKFTYGEKVEFQFKNIEGFKYENGKVFPVMSIWVIKNEKDTIFNEPNLLAELENGTDLTPLVLNAHIIAALPFENNEKYKVVIKIGDKKGEGTFEYELPFVIEKNSLIKINSKNISYSNIYLWDETDKFIVVDKNVNSDHNYILIFDEINGLEIVDNKIYPSLSTEIIDSKGNQLFSSGNALEKYQDSGVVLDDSKKAQLSIKLKFGSDIKKNPCKLKATLLDLKSNNKIDTESELEIHSSGN